MTNKNETVPGSRAGVSWGSGSHRPNGAHIRGLPRGPQPCGQTGAELKVLVSQPSFPTGMGDPPELLAAQVLLLPVVYTNPGSGIHIMTWGQARSWGAGSPQWDRGARRMSVRPLAPSPSRCETQDWRCLRGPSAEPAAWVPARSGHPGDCSPWVSRGG